ncbi:MAG: TlpA family protein disulfide reductase [Acidobacteria bacterium]|nr:TlpA family protein disulfide reductase [Acidobacteriota bacterium]MBI3424036.1 TlpA family protein disulfide reductase [Acidobacteriota bacterium]
MLVKTVLQDFPGQARFVNENWGTSKLAARFGIKRYPVVFVDDVLIAKPNDFGWMGEQGKYTPWREPANHEKFKQDLTRMLKLALRDRAALKRAGQNPSDGSTELGELTALPAFTAPSLDGGTVDSTTLGNRVVIVEFWATWCGPCRSTLQWLGEVKQRYGDQISVVAISVESEEAEVRQLIEQRMGPRKLPVQFVLGKEELIKPFGTITSVPTMYVFDRHGQTVSIFYGAPEDLHAQVGRLLGTLLKN